MAYHPFTFLDSQMPVKAVEVLQQRKAERIFSTSPFGGYLVSRDIKAFIDGRAEFYGEQFVIDYFDAVTAKDVETLLKLLDTYKIDATLLTPTLPATKVLDHLPGWKRLYADGIAVIHVRDDRKTNLSSAPDAANSFPVSNSPPTLFVRRRAISRVRARAAAHSRFAATAFDSSDRTPVRWNGTMKNR